MSKAKKAVPSVPVEDDAPDIAPALSDQEWAAWRNQRLNPVTMMREVSAFPPNPDNLAKTIALAFDQLHDEDVRKIARRETVEMLRASAERISASCPNLQEDSDAATVREAGVVGEMYSGLHELADVIESYCEPDWSIDRNPFKNDDRFLGFSK